MGFGELQFINCVGKGNRVILRPKDLALFYLSRSLMGFVLPPARDLIAASLSIFLLVHSKSFVNICKVRIFRIICSDPHVMNAEYAINAIQSKKHKKKHRKTKAYITNHK